MCEDRAEDQPKRLRNMHSIWFGLLYVKGSVLLLACVPQMHKVCVPRVSIKRTEVLVACWGPHTQRIPSDLVAVVAWESRRIIATPWSVVPVQSRRRDWDSQVS